MAHKYMGKITIASVTAKNDSLNISGVMNFWNRDTKQQEPTFVLVICGRGTISDYLAKDIITGNTIEVMGIIASLHANIHDGKPSLNCVIFAKHIELGYRSKANKEKHEQENAGYSDNSFGDSNSMSSIADQYT